MSGSLPRTRLHICGWICYRMQSTFTEKDWPTALRLKTHFINNVSRTASDLMSVYGMSRLSLLQGTNH